MVFFIVNLDLIGPLFSLIIAALFFYVKKTRPSFTDKIILSFWILQVILITIGLYLLENRINNHWIYHLNSFCSQLLFARYYYCILDTPRQKKLVLMGLLLFVVFYLIEIFFIHSLYTFNSYSYALNALLIVGYAYMSLRMLINNLPTENVLHLKIFWFAAAIFLYFGASFFIFISYHYLSQVLARHVGILWRMHNLFLGISCVIFLKTIASKTWISK